MPGNEESSRDYYYDYEVAGKLGIPESELWRMRLPRSSDDDIGTIPRQFVDSIARSWSEVLCFEYQETYYRLDEFADAIAREPEALVDDPTIFYEQPWVSKEEADKIIEKRRADRHKGIRARLPSPTPKRDAKEQSAETLIQSLREKIDAQEQSAESRIQAIQEELERERAAKKQKADDAKDFEKWLDKCQEMLDKEKSKNRQLIEDRQNDESTISTELENSRQRIHEYNEENENLKTEHANLTAEMEHMKSEVHLLSKIRRLLDAERAN